MGKIKWLFVGVFLFGTLPIFSQSLDNILFQNFKANGQLLELEVQVTDFDYPIVMGIVKNNQVYPAPVVIRLGKHYYDFRELDQWTGKVDYLVTNIPSDLIRSKKLVAPSLSSELDILMSEELFSPKIVNFATPKRFFGKSFTLTLGLIAICLILLTKFFFRQSFLTSIFIGVILTTFLSSARGMVDQWRILQRAERNYPYVSPIDEVQEFVIKARPIIGQQPWSFQGGMRDEYFKLYIIYGLADKPFRARINRKRAKNLIKITRRPMPSQEVLLEANGFYLVQ